MYTVECYTEDGLLLDDTVDKFDNFDDAYEFAEDMASDVIFVNIVTPNGRTVCL